MISREKKLLIKKGDYDKCGIGVRFSKTIF